MTPIIDQLRRIPPPSVELSPDWQETARSLFSHIHDVESLVRWATQQLAEGGTRVDVALLTDEQLRAEAEAHWGEDNEEHSATVCIIHPEEGRCTQLKGTIGKETEFTWLREGRDCIRWVIHDVLSRNLA